MTIRRDAGLTEAAWQAEVVRTARALGFLVYHTYDSRRSDKGFPDLTMVRRDRVLFAELKTQKGRIRPEQRVWLDRLAAGPGEVYLWRPDDAPEVEAVLGSRHAPPSPRTAWLAICRTS